MPPNRAAMLRSSQKKNIKPNCRKAFGPQRLRCHHRSDRQPRPLPPFFPCVECLSAFQGGEFERGFSFSFFSPMRLPTRADASRAKTAQPVESAMEFPICVPSQILIASSLVIAGCLDEAQSLPHLGGVCPRRQSRFGAI